VHLPLAGSSLENCVIVSNRATGGNGAGATVAAGSSIRNCLVAYNTAAGVAGGVDLSGTMRSCTVASNTASILVGGVRGAAVGSVVLNSIVYHNKAGSRLNHNEAGENAVWTNCCTTPDLVSKGVGCKYADPKFVDRGAGNFRLDGASPCIDAGRYESWMSAAVDLDKRPRLQRGAVDMGAYELPPAGTAIVLY
jgi:hypothetical protein